VLGRKRLHRCTAASRTLANNKLDKEQCNAHVPDAMAAGARCTVVQGVGGSEFPLSGGNLPAY
jgi:hypothetical protein